MRQPTDTCLLCKREKATKRKSHLIPKFFGKGIFVGSKPRHGIMWSKDGKTEKVQDIIKEDYLFCPNCEQSFSVLETYCSRHLERFNNVRYANKYNRFKRGDFECFDCKELDIKIFNLFIYSIVWRVSVSSNFAFQNFKLPELDEEEIRIVLNTIIKPRQTDLLNNLINLRALPNHSHVLIRPKKKLNPPSSMLSGASYDESVHQLFLVDYVMFYVTNKEKLVEVFNEIDNNRLEGLVKIGLTDPTKWENYNYDVMSKFI